MKVSLSYGDGKICLQVPDENFGGLVSPRENRAEGEREDPLVVAMRNPEGGFLTELARGKKVCFLWEDFTRSEPHEAFLDAMFPSLLDASAISLILATGSHDPKERGNRDLLELACGKARKYGLAHFEALVHDCHNHPMMEAGTTSFGTPVKFNLAAEECDLFVVASEMKFHYFAGYSNAVKDFVPGISSFETIEHNHALALDPLSTFGRHPYHPDPSRREQPLAEDMVEGMQLIRQGRPAFTLACISDGRQALWARAGILDRVVALGIEEVDRTSLAHVEPSRFIVVSAGGFPADESIYNAQRALENTKQAVLPGGEILFLAECRNGIASSSGAKEHFYDILSLPPEEALRRVRERYVLYSHKAYKCAQLLQEVQKVWIYSSLPDEIWTDIHFSPAFSPQEVIDAWLKEEVGCRVLFFDKSYKLAVFPQ